MSRLVRTAMVSTLLQPIAVAAQAPIPPDAIDRVASAVLTPRLGKDIGSGTVVVVQGDRVVYLRSFGLARSAGNVAAVPDSTVYQVGSNSKLFVATAAMQLAEQGKLDLDADVNQYLRDMQVDGRGAPVTMAQLLTHTSGIQDRKLGRAQAASDGPLMTLGAFFGRFPPRRVVSGGTELNYSGNAMSLAAHVVEEVSGERFYQYAERHIFQPLSMASASFRQPLRPDLLARRASMPAVPPLIEYPEGGLAMTAADMGRFLVAQLNGGAPILRPETLGRMHAHHFPADSTMPGIAYGFFEANLNGHRALVHTGDYQHQSVLGVVPDAGLAFFLVVNPLGELHEPLLMTFVAEFARTFLPESHPADASMAPRIATAEARRYVGRYRDDAIPKESVERFFVGLLFGEGDARVTYDADSAALFFVPPGSPPLRLAPMSTARFRTVDRKFGAELMFHGAAAHADGFFVSAGPLGAYSFSRIPGIAAQPPQMAAVAVMLLAFGVWCLYVIVRMARSLTRGGRARPPAPAAERLALWSATAPAALAAGGFVAWCIMAPFTPPLAMITGVPAFFYVLPVAFTAACITAPWAVYGAVKTWRTQPFGRATRALYVFVVISAVGLIPFSAYWSLLGIRI